jgi:hypothetical protein
VRDVSWLTVDLKILKAVMERIVNHGMKAEALYISKLGFANIIPTAEQKNGETNWSSPWLISRRQFRRGTGTSWVISYAGLLVTG